MDVVTSYDNGIYYLPKIVTNPDTFIPDLKLNFTVSKEYPT